MPVRCICEWCAREFFLKPSAIGRNGQGRFCSRACSGLGRPKPLLIRFQAKFDADPDGCWGWRGNRLVNGYGVIRDRGVVRYAHRVAWEFAHGPIPDGMHVLHCCDNPPCVRPDHLFLGTFRINMADKLSKGRQARGEAMRHKLTEAAVREIRQRYAAGGIRQIDLARRFGVARSLVSLIASQKRWAHVS